MGKSERFVSKRNPQQTMRQHPQALGFLMQQLAGARICQSLLSNPNCLPGGHQLVSPEI
jgi:hypothetical protein